MVVSFSSTYRTSDTYQSPRAYYYLAEHTTISNQRRYELYACEPVGLFCRQVEFEGARLYQDGQVLVVDQGGGEFAMDRYSLEPPPSN